MYKVNHHIYLRRAIREIFPDAITVKVYQRFDKETKMSTYMVAYQPVTFDFEWFEIVLPNRHLPYAELLWAVRSIV